MMMRNKKTNIVKCFECAKHVSANVCPHWHIGYPIDEFDDALQSFYTPFGVFHCTAPE
jgi:hypothetical protein